jgi:hypothetical protein
VTETSLHCAPAFVVCNQGESFAITENVFRKSILDFASKLTKKLRRLARFGTVRNWSDPRRISTELGLRRWNNPSSYLGR